MWYRDTWIIWIIGKEYHNTWEPIPYKAAVWWQQCDIKMLFALIALFCLVATIGADSTCLNYFPLHSSYMDFHRINPNLVWSNTLASDACYEAKQEEITDAKHRLVATMKFDGKVNNRIVSVVRKTLRSVDRSEKEKVRDLQPMKFGCNSMNDGVWMRVVCLYD
ncbi:hypothetical protein COOONC_12589 [Cooperia oncophora]